MSQITSFLREFFSQMLDQAGLWTVQFPSTDSIAGATDLPSWDRHLGLWTESTKTKFRSGFWAGEKTNQNHWPRDGCRQPNSHGFWELVIDSKTHISHANMHQVRLVGIGLFLSTAAKVWCSPALGSSSPAEICHLIPGQFARRQEKLVKPGFKIWYLELYL
jgi:hypothetical protein